MNLSVTRAGFQCTVQDLGRVGHRTSGVSTGGALDRHALTVANLLVGNAPAAAGLEATLGILRLRFSDDRIVAWCGGAFSATIEGALLSAGRPAFVRSGEEVVVVAPSHGARAWIAIGGGIEVPRLLGSSATDLRSHFGGYGGRAVADGDVLPIGASSALARRIGARLRESRRANWSAPNEWAETAPPHAFLRVVRGANWSSFAPSALASLQHETFAVLPDSDRMGVRLDGPELAREDRAELLSEAVAPGTIQVPPSGEPILLLGDCQTIGGYPKIAHVITVDLPAAAQLRPGYAVRFVEVSLAEAQQRLIERTEDLKRFQIGLELQTP